MIVTKEKEHVQATKHATANQAGNYMIALVKKLLWSFQLIYMQAF